MTKYSFEIKKKIVSEYLSRNKSSSYLARKYGITNKNEILKWVAIYKTLGDDGLMRSRKDKNYSFEFKLLSCQYICYTYEKVFQNTCCFIENYKWISQGVKLCVP